MVAIKLPKGVIKAIDRRCVVLSFGLGRILAMNTSGLGLKDLVIKASLLGNKFVPQEH